ncbi:MAG: hypothetical protein ACE14M_11625 [Terriglobales bacterium]
MKTYTADTGYVYQYYFVGKRDALPGAPEAPATEYVFDVTCDRKSVFAFSVFVCADALDAWALTHARSLTEAEQYAAAKLRLLRGFDEIRNLAQSDRRLAVNSQNVEELLSVLGLE